MFDPAAWIDAVPLMIDQLGNGLVIGIIIGITSIGLSLVFGVTRLVNFAHGDLVTLGAVFALVFSRPGGATSPAGLDLPFGVAIGIAVIGGALVGAGLELGLFRPLRRRNVGGVTLLIVTIGLALAIRHGIQIWIGGSPIAYPLAPERQQTYLGFLDMTPRDGVIVIASIVIMVAVGVFLTSTRLGTAMRAVADNEALSESSGIDVDRVILTAWVLGGALAATGGVFQGMTTTVRWNMGFLLLLLMFAGVILGGIGSPFGAMVGGILIGLITEMSASTPLLEGRTDLKFAVAMGVMVLILLVRPQGLLGTRERVS
ncbi:MAG: branched-chain amino acid ABC transporter permease [Acidimicrobiia bacterium]|nr:branched-chain amino acid ABC transporter permease [Acidimicrobiia bacterium]